METKNTSIYLKSEVRTLAIGRFDGLHIGHKGLFDRLDNYGAVLIIDTENANLTPPRYLCKYLEIPYFIYKLEEIRNLSASEFVSKLRVDFVNLDKIIVGDDFRFGRDRGAGLIELKQLFFNIEVVHEIKIDNIGVHSRYIRSLLFEGNVEKAAIFLGRLYRIYGNVVIGQGLGSRALYPTVNIHCKDFFIPDEGVYITKIFMNDLEYKSISFIGHRLSTDGNYAIETHILDSSFLSAKTVCIEFHKRVRGNKYFKDLKKLKIQIAKDIQIAKNYFDNLDIHTLSK